MLSANSEKSDPIKKELSALDEHLQFENLLGVLSANLVNLPLESIDNAINDSIKMLSEFFSADRCHIGKLNNEDDDISTIFYFAKPNILEPHVEKIGTNLFKYIHNSIKCGNIVSFKNPEELPKEAEMDKRSFAKIGVKSLLVIPLTVDNKVKYGLSLSTIKDTIKWSSHTIKHIQIVGNIFANVLSRKHIIETSNKEKLWSESILQSMPQIAYVFDEEGRIKRWNKNLEIILGYNQKEIYNKFVLDFVDEKHKEETFNKFTKVVTEGKDQVVEYNLVTKFGDKLPYRGSGSLTIIDGEKHLIGMAIDISDLKKSHELIEKQLKEIKRLKVQIEAENIYLKDELKRRHGFDEIIGKDEALLHSLFRIEQVAPMDSTVLLEGETGTGKELFARAIHSNSKRSNKPLITLNCASIPTNLFESELFGHEKGAFTGASDKQIGKFELANGGTLFLDEIGELPYNVQAKLLRVLQEGTFERIGGKKTIKVDVRVIAATNRILEVEVENKMFRADLYYRLNVYPVTIAPLRERLSDIPLLVEHFLDKYNKKFGKEIKVISKKTIYQLQKYPWPGNIRELENIIERALIISTSSKLDIGELPINKSKQKEEEFISLQEYERKYIISVLEKTFWRVDGPSGAAKILDMHPETLRSRMRKLLIQRPK